MPNISKYRPTVSVCADACSPRLLIVMVARPQMGSKISTISDMALKPSSASIFQIPCSVRDVVPSRLDKGKMLIENLVDNFNNDKIGLIVLCRRCVRAVANHHRLCFGKDVSPEHDPWSYPDQGTNIGEAIDLASKSFTQQENVGRAIIVITDGENHEPERTGRRLLPTERNQCLYPGHR